MGIYEIGMRGWEIKGRSMRPERRMIAHTGSIFVARKCSACEQEKINYRTQINACGLCPHPRKPGKGLINTDEKSNAVSPAQQEQKKKSV